MKSNVNKRTIIILALIICLAVLRLIYCFANYKEDLHIDEIWSYGLANSHNEPFIFAEDDKVTLKNFNEWIGSDAFLNYITVGEDEKFDYPSIWYNQKYDDHPPFYYILLHTVCSFFPNTYSPWFGFAINISAFLVLMLFSFFTAKLMTSSDFFALSFIAYLGFSDGILNLFMFIRMYALSTAIFSAFMFFTFRLMKTGKISKNVPPAFFTLFLGAFTHHFFIIAAGILVALVSVYLLIKHKFKIMLINGFACVGAVGLSFLAFPATVEHLIRGHFYGTAPPFMFSFRTCIGTVTRELFAFNVSPFKTMAVNYILSFLLVITAVCVPLLFLFRRNNWVRKHVFEFPRNIRNYYKKHDKTALCFALICVASFFMLCAVVTRIINVLYMSDHLDRYLFIIYPALTIGAVYIIYGLSVCLFGKYRLIGKTVFCFILAGFVIVSTYKTGCRYYFPKPDGYISLSETISDSDVILAMGKANSLTNYSDEFMNADKVFIFSFDYYKYARDEVTRNVSAVNDDNPMYLLVTSNYLINSQADETNFENILDNAMSVDENEMMEFLKSLPVVEKFEYVGQDSVFGDIVSVYKIRD